jgi:hypothetical protein
MKQIALRPQDVLVLAKLVSYGGVRPPMARVGLDLGISGSEIHASLRRLAVCRLVSAQTDGTRPLLQSVEEFLVHGVRYACPALRGEVTRGVPTSYAAPPLNSHIRAGSDLPPVWPHAEGQTQGVSLEPLYRTVPEAALRDGFLYEVLALIDALREGRSRERKLAEKELSHRLHSRLDG